MSNRNLNESNNENFSIIQDEIDNLKQKLFSDKTYIIFCVKLSEDIKKRGWK